MHVEVSLRGATFFVVFNDYENIPPPYRIDNLSEVSHKISYNYQQICLYTKFKGPYAQLSLTGSEVRMGLSGFYFCQKITLIHIFVLSKLPT